MLTGRLADVTCYGELQLILIDPLLETFTDYLPPPSVANVLVRVQVRIRIDQIYRISYSLLMSLIL